MKQQTQSVENIVKDIQKRSRPFQDAFISSQQDEQWVIPKSEVYRIINSIISKLTHSEAQLSATQKTLKQRDNQIKIKEKEINIARQQLQRLKHLLPIKDQLLKHEQNEVAKLLKKNKQLQIEMEGCLQKMMMTKRGLDYLPQCQADQFQAMRGASSCPLRLRSCSNHAKEAKYKKQGHQKDLELAKLKNEISKLQDENKVLKVDLELLRIENSHLSQECHIACRRERELHSIVVELLSGQRKSNQIQTWSDKCSQIQLFVDRITEERLEEKPARASLRYQCPHPPTPHFSSSTGFFFSKQPKLISTAAQTMFPLQELSLGEGDLCFSDSCPPSV